MKICTIELYKLRDDHMKDAYNWEEFMNALNGRNIVLTPWCHENDCEKKVKDRSKEESMKSMAEAGEEEEVLTGAAKTLMSSLRIQRLLLRKVTSASIVEKKQRLRHSGEEHTEEKGLIIIPSYFILERKIKIELVYLLD